MPIPCGKDACNMCGKCAPSIDTDTMDYNIEFSTAQDESCLLSTKVNLFFDSAVQYAAAIDIGTTNIEIRLYSLPAGEHVKTARVANKQGKYGADIMSRINHALTDRQSLHEIINEQIDEVFAGFGAKCDAAVVVGNTATMYFYANRCTNSFAAAPFKTNGLFAEMIENDIGKVYLPPCVSAFVGADLIAAVLWAEFTRGRPGAVALTVEGDFCPKNYLLVDVGTNGEIALFHDGTYYCTSTAAGPAFEGCGAHGSDVIKAIAAGLDSGEIDESGYMEDSIVVSTTPSSAVADATPPGRGIWEYTFSPHDMRNFQLAKSAIRSGMDSLIAHCGISYDEVDMLYVAGLFGAKIEAADGVRIGLFPAELKDKVQHLGNAAIYGASLMLLDKEQTKRAEEIAKNAEHVDLMQSKVFPVRFMENMGF